MSALADLVLDALASQPLIANATVYRARCGRREAFPTPVEAALYEDGWNDFQLSRDLATPFDPPEDSAALLGWIHAAIGWQEGHA